jgi:hypothetical protein
MKKTALAVAICGSLGFSAAHAATVSEFANGVLVPFVIDGGAGNQTAIGLTSCAAGTVYWTFFDVDSRHQADGTFAVSQNDQVNIVWGNPSTNLGSVIGGLDRPDLDDVPGYMVFILDGNNRFDGSGSTNRMLDSSDSPCLAGNAFQIDTQNNDVAYTPALPLDAAVGDFGAPDAGVYVEDLVATDQNTVVGLNAGANLNDDIYLRYFVDNTQNSGNDTTMYIWSTTNITNPFDFLPLGTFTVLMYDIDQNFFSANLRLADQQLNIIDVEQPTTPDDVPLIENRPIELLDGFVVWTVPAVAGDVVSWSVISSDAFGAVQTVMNPIRQLNSVDDPVFRVKLANPGFPEVLTEEWPSFWLFDPTLNNVIYPDDTD